MICYHGTTKKGLKAILSGVNHKPNNPWCVSDQDGVMYVWPSNKLAEQYEHEDESQMICHAFESAEVQAVTSDETEVFVLLLDIPEDMLEDDFSCENMSDVASCINLQEFNKNMIVGIKSHKLNKWNAPFVLSGLLSNPNFNTYSLDDDLLQAAEVIATCEVYKDPTEFYDYDEYEI
ncbi:MAG: hypothetical protein GY928_05465 [Colwellia sp.]|nr:hypothetical protein [Colwellia sp.]